MTEKIRILFLSANPWTTSRILVDEEAREIFERIQEGPYRTRFELYNHAATRPIDLQRLLLLYTPHIVHFSGHGNKKQKLILGGTPGRGKTVDRQGLVELLALYNAHLRLVLLNACFTKVQARLISEVIDYAVGTGTGIGDKAGVAFAGAFYRALGFGKSITDAFDSAKAELALTKMPRTQGIELFVREGASEPDSFPQFDTEAETQHRPIDPRYVFNETEERFEYQITVFGRSGSTRFIRKRIWSEVVTKSAARCESPEEGITSDKIMCEMTAASRTINRKDRKMPRYGNMKQMQKDSTPAHTRLTALPKSGRKAPGTRLGMIQDWREGSNKSGKTSVGICKTLRDGR